MEYSRLCEINRQDAMGVKQKTIFCFGVLGVPRRRLQSRVSVPLLEMKAVSSPQRLTAFSRVVQQNWEA